MTRLHKKLLTGTVGLLLLLLGAYTYLWFHAAERLEKWVLIQIDKLKEKGYTPAYDLLEVTGFPFRLELKLKNPVLQLPLPFPFKIMGKGTLTATTSLWNPRSVKLNEREKTSLVVVGTEEKEVLASLSSVEADLPYHLETSPFDYSFHVTELKVGDWQAQQLQYNSTVDLNTRKTSVRLEVDAFSFKPPSQMVLPNLIEHFLVDALITDLPDRFDDNVKATLQTWYDRNGVVDVKVMEMRWGNMRINSNGSFSLDENLQPLATFSGKVYGARHILTLLVQNRLINETLVPILSTVLNALVQGGTDGKESYHALSLSLQDRELSINSIPVAKIGPIHWNSEFLFRK
jgi:hypothetical protein